jgi:DNA-binding NtrC family response regulator
MLAVARNLSKPRLRTRDRRRGLSVLLAALVENLADCQEPLELRTRFESALPRVVPVRTARVRDGECRYAAAPAPLLPAPETLCLNIPTGDPGRCAILEATFDPTCALDEWDFQTLDVASSLAALILEVERRTGRPPVLPAPRGSVRPLLPTTPPLIGTSLVMRALRERIERVAATDFTVLIEGESGTGKELVARQIHDLSRRRHGPFVAINCAALVETLVEAELFGIEDRTATGVRGRRGKFEQADGGTLFLDEVSDLSMSAQAKLLRAIQDLAVERVGGHGTRRIDTRIVIATNRSLGEWVTRGLFRKDLYYRLSGVELAVPPLRARRGDILELASYFLGRHRAVRRLELAPAAADALNLYQWPGNVRELERLLESAVAWARTDRIELDDLPPVLRGDYAEVLVPSLAHGDTLRTWGSRYARLVLERCGNNKRRACRVLDISYHTLQAYLRYQPGGPAEKGPPPPEWLGDESELGPDPRS